MAARKKKTVKKVVPKTAELLVEIGTEELPPKSLRRLSAAFTENLYTALLQADLIGEVQPQPYATPRRLAVRLAGVALRQPDRIEQRRGPTLRAAFDAKGKPTKAALGFARSCGVAVEKLTREETSQGAWLVYRAKRAGRTAKEIVPEVVAQALNALPVAKRMRWGDGDAEFVRPIQWVVVLHGAAIIATEILSCKSGRLTFGHRFHAPKPLRLREAKDYPKVLEKSGYVIANFERRRSEIKKQVERIAVRLKATAVISEALLDEVTALVEWPNAIAGQFDKKFLDIPREALISTMRTHQRYFHVLDKQGNLLPYFITVANIHAKDKTTIRQGNERVLCARFSDAEFFWNNDRKQPLAARQDQLSNVVFHVKLGSLMDKVVRVTGLATTIAKTLRIERKPIERAAMLSKCDLLTGMVSEFPELQGIMGRYYAQHDNESAEVANALEAYYLPRHAGDRLPEGRVSQVLAVADRIDTLVGIFGVNEVPSGDKDPFGLRRAALAVLRIIIECDLDLNLIDLLGQAAQQYGSAIADHERCVEKVYQFMMERLRAYYTGSGITVDIFSSVLVQRPSRPLDFDRRVRAVLAFRKMPEAESLAAANKRIMNILKKAKREQGNGINTELLKEPQEIQLAQVVETLQHTLPPMFERGDYTAAMKQLARLRPQVDSFFDEVMVMAEDHALRDNRIKLLAQLNQLFLCVADLSQLH